MVAPVHEHHALVPNADRTALLVVDGRLPVVRVEEPRLRDAMVALRGEHGLEAPFLRVVRRTDNGDDVTTLIELDTPPDAPRGEWMPLRAVEPERIVPVFADGVERWLDEQSGAPIPSERPAWARPGWLAEATTWVNAAAIVRGQPELVRQWPLSAVYRFETASGALYLKAVFTLFRHEPAVTAALARDHLGDVPEVVATDGDRGWILMRELPGASARGEQAGEGVRTAARIQQAWAGRADELRSLGCPGRELDQLRAESPSLVHLCDRLAEHELPDSIVHGDLHHGNMFVSGDRVAVIDWSDAAVGNPLLDLATVLFVGDKKREPIVDAFVDAWSFSREVASVAEALGCVYQAISYRALNAALEPDDRWLFADEYARWMERAERLAAALS
jgi:aminoglycoside phosphotransferase